MPRIAARSGVRPRGTVCADWCMVHGARMPHCTAGTQGESERARACRNPTDLDERPEQRDDVARYVHTACQMCAVCQVYILRQVYLGDLDDLLKSRARTVLVLLLEGAAQHLPREPHALLRRACVCCARCMWRVPSCGFAVHRAAQVAWVQHAPSRRCAVVSPVQRVARLDYRVVPVQTWEGARPVPVQMWAG